MTDFLPFMLSVLGLLATPGPTNTLMAAAGAQRGLAATPFILGELAGYLIAIAVWSTLIGAIGASHPFVPVLAKLVAAGFLLWSAWKLWSDAGHTNLKASGITIGRVFGTTLVNPKALIFAFVIFPQVGIVQRLPYFGLFSVLVTITASAWLSLGTVAARSWRGVLTSARIEKGTAVALACFATVLVIQTVTSLP